MKYLIVKYTNHRIKNISIKHTQVNNCYKLSSLIKKLY